MSMFSNRMAPLGDLKGQTAPKQQTVAERWGAATSPAQQKRDERRLRAREALGGSASPLLMRAVSGQKVNHSDVLLAMASDRQQEMDAANEQKKFQQSGLAALQSSGQESVANLRTAAGEALAGAQDRITASQEAGLADVDRAQAHAEGMVGRANEAEGAALEGAEGRRDRAVDEFQDLATQKGMLAAQNVRRQYDQAEEQLAEKFGGNLNDPAYKAELQRMNLGRANALGDVSAKIGISVAENLSKITMGYDQMTNQMSGIFGQLRGQADISSGNLQAQIADIGRMYRAQGEQEMQAAEGRRAQLTLAAESMNRLVGETVSQFWMGMNSYVSPIAGIVAAAYTEQESQRAISRQEAEDRRSRGSSSSSKAPQMFGPQLGAPMGRALPSPSRGRASKGSIKGTSNYTTNAMATANRQETPQARAPNSGPDPYTEPDILPDF